MRHWLVLGALVFFVAPAAGQLSPPVFELPEVIVPGRRPQSRSATPASVSVVTRADLIRLGARTVADALRLLPETVVRSYGGMGSLAEASIRGFGPGQVLVLLDGVPLNNVALGQADLSTISIAGIDRIEVLRGPFGAISGSGAVGGVINIITAAPQEMIRIHAGGHGDRLGGLAVASGPWGVTVEGAASAGHRPNSDFTGGTILVQHRPSDGLRLFVHHYTADLGTPGDAAMPTPLDRQATRRTVAQAQWEGASRGRIFMVHEALSFWTPFGNSTYGSEMMGAEVQRSWELTPARVLTAGVEASAASLDAVVFGTPIRRATGVGAMTLQYDAALSPRTLTSLGLRLDAHSVYGITANPRAGVVYALDERTRARAAVGRTFRGPTFLHLYFPGCSDPTLRPETAWSAEVGVERDLAGGLIGGTLFAAEAVDLISGGCPPTNVGAASIRGGSLEFRGRLGPNLTGVFHATIQSALDRTAGSPLPRVPSTTAGATVTFEPRDGRSLVVSLLYVGPRPDQDFSVFPAVTVQMPGYMDVRLRYHHLLPSGWTLMVGVDNALDAGIEAVKGFPSPGRTFFLTVDKRY